MARIAGVNLPNNKRIEVALTYIYPDHVRTWRPVSDKPSASILRYRKLVEEFNGRFMVFKPPIRKGSPAVAFQAMIPLNWKLNWIRCAGLLIWLFFLAHAPCAYSRGMTIPKHLLK